MKTVLRFKEFFNLDDREQIKGCVKYHLQSQEIQIGEKITDADTDASIIIDGSIGMADMEMISAFIFGYMLQMDKSNFVIVFTNEGKQMFRCVTFECPDPPFLSAERKYVYDLLAQNIDYQNIGFHSRNYAIDGKPFHSTVFDLYTDMPLKAIQDILRIKLGTFFNEIKF